VEPRLQHVRKVLDHFPSERFYKINGARIVLISESALLQDIFKTEENEMPAALSHELCDWLRQEAAVLSAPHLCASEVHSAVDFSDQDQVHATRLPRYGRACSRIMKLPREVVRRQIGTQQHSYSSFLWLDSKGTGVRPNLTPKCEEYATGLLPLDEALEEYLWSRILDKVMEHGGAAYRCLPIYGIVDLGFEFRDPVGNIRAASVLLRRGHLRNASSDLPMTFTREHLSCLIIELLIRNYGITSTAEQPSKILLDGSEISIFSEKRQEVVAKLKASDIDVDLSRISGAEIDQINIQFGWSGLSPELELVDTGQYRIADSFIRPLVSSVADRLGAWGGVILPDSPDFVQPDEEISLDNQGDGWSVESNGTSMKRTKIACKRLARLIVDRSLEVSETKSVLDGFASKLTDKLNKSVAWCGSSAQAS